MNVIEIPDELYEHQGDLDWLEEHGLEAMKEYVAQYPERQQREASLVFAKDMFRFESIMFGAVPSWYRKGIMNLPSSIKELLADPKYKDQARHNASRSPKAVPRIRMMTQRITRATMMNSSPTDTKEVIMRGYSREMKRLVEKGEMIVVQNEDGTYSYERTEKGKREMAKEVAENEKKREARIAELKRNGVKFSQPAPINDDEGEE